ncbi:hypothetical protein FGLOB1_19 [Fusarium globosum]|uniref:Calcineurin-like phosphoesterase domain-containing protein n=1 Tax=Fusarium globosum TaxID=78864 RepID=A0A8H5Z238_9HYPO|nr:hypothetical protein FGLOB1_19 [Fusarium globosum]
MAAVVKLPKGDVLIHAGDLTNQGSHAELAKTVAWLEKQDFEAKIVIAGNHDLTLDPKFYAEHGLYFHNKNPQSHDECLQLFTSSPSITYLSHESTTVASNLHRGRNPSHWSDLTSLWQSIPLDADIVVTHTPARTHCDETDERRATGCEALRQALWRVRPQLAVCGHIHDGRGAKRVRWDLSCRNVAYQEESVERWQDPGEGNNKTCLIDLTGKKAPSLANDGSHPGRYGSSMREPDVTDVRHFVDLSESSPYALGSGPADIHASHGTIGLGGDPASPRSDQAALAGRMGRRETCVVNAAIMKSRYPHIGGKQFNKPIVVDLDLPIWEDESHIEAP